MRPYCAACGVGVETELSEHDGRTIFHCVNCGFVVEGAPPASTGTRPAGDGAAPAPPIHSPSTALRSVVIADDSAVFRKMLLHHFENGGISKHARACANGEEFVQTVAEELLAGSPIDLVILDVGMPVLNGYCSAVVLRALERAFRISPTPILFFSARVCDETFKKVLQYCAPARYLNKGVTTGNEQLPVRLKAVVGSLHRK